MHKPKVSLRFGLLLEAYCRSLGPYLKLILKQVEALDKLTKLSETLEERKDETSRVSWQPGDTYKQLSECSHPLNDIPII